MTTSEALLSFTAAAGLLTLTPGLDTALVLRTAAVEGGRRALLAGIGVCLGCLVWGLAVSVGLGGLLAVSRVAYNVLRIAGAVYLIYLGIRLLTRPARSLDLEGRVKTQANWFARGLFTNLLNPKVGVFYVTFLPQFVPTGASVTSFSMLLAGIHALEGLCWFAILVLATRPLARWLKRPGVTKGLDRVTGVVFVGFGVGLLLDRRPA
ncbi:MAG TPA: LysE family translocator [Gemmatimonadales bacterium]|nr:LysE family translocator [Gemmatimonadales bacterium]